MNNKKFSLSMLALLMVGCTNIVTTPGYQSAVYINEDFKDLDQEYSAFHTQALTKKYLDRKLKKWIGPPAMGDKMVKELKFALHKHQSLLQGSLNNDSAVLTAINSMPEVISQKASDPPFANFFNGLGKIFTFAGNNSTGAGGPATLAFFRSPTRVVTDNSGNFFILDQQNNKISKVNSSGIISDYAGGGSGSADNVQATSNSLQSPNGICTDASGNLYITEYGVNKIRKVTPAGVITTVVGNGTRGFSGDGGQATAAQINNPFGITIDSAGNIFFTDFDNYRVRKVTTAGIISTVAGNGTFGYSGDNGQATLAAIKQSASVAVDNNGNLYIADGSNYRIRKVTPAGIITSIAGNGSQGYSGDGGQATAAQIGHPSDVITDSAGNVYIADVNNSRVRKVSTAGIMSTYAGTGISGASGDGGAASDARLDRPYGITFDNLGNMFISDIASLTVRKIVSGNISTVAGGNGDGGPATQAQFGSTAGVTGDAAGNIYIVDSGAHKVRKVSPAGVITTIAGSGGAGFSGDGGPATAAKFSTPKGIALDNSGNIYISEANNNRVRKINSSGIISTFAGTGSQGPGGDGGQATAAQLILPNGLATDNNGNVYIADQVNHRVRKVNSSGIISTIAGTGSPGFSGDGGQATAAQLKNPMAVALDDNGNIYIADSQNARIRKINGSGVISTIAGNGISNWGGDGGQATAASVGSPNGIAVDAAGNVYIADNRSSIRKVDSSGIITSVAGNGAQGYGGDGGSPTAALLKNPYGVYINAGGSIFITDDNRVVRKVF